VKVFLLYASSKLCEGISSEVKDMRIHQIIISTRYYFSMFHVIFYENHVLYCYCIVLYLQTFLENVYDVAIGVSSLKFGLSLSKILGPPLAR